MNTLESLHVHLGSVFVTSVFLESFSGGLASNIAMMIGSDTAHTGGGFHLGEVQPAFPLAAALRAVHDICTDADITDEESLVGMLDTIR